MNTFQDPWLDLKAPSGVGETSAIRADPHSTWDFYWSLNYENHPQLTLVHAKAPTGKLPAFEGFRVTSTPSAEGNRLLNFALTGDQSREIFHTLCLDLVNVTNDCATEDEAVKMSINRAWVWHRMLRGERDARMTTNEQQGLMGELHVLKTALSHADNEVVIESWKAPEENAKDFIYQANALEIKAKRSVHSANVHITSAEQLDTHDFSSVILTIVNVVKDDPDGTDLHTYSQKIINELAIDTPDLAILFHQRLVQRGLWPEHDYSADKWRVVSVDYYSFGPGFPCIQGSALPPGVSNVTYSVDINSIKPFQITEEQALTTTYVLGGPSERQ